jgi:hypothetical protein
MDDSSYLSQCTTTISIKPEELISKKYLFDFTSNENAVNLISVTLLSGEKLKHNSPQNIDARLVIVLDHNNNQPGIFAFKNEFEMLFNDTVTYNYSFPIIDSILHLIGRDKLLCPLL